MYSYLYACARGPGGFLRRVQGLVRVPVSALASEARKGLLIMCCCV